MKKTFEGMAMALKKIKIKINDDYEEVLYLAEDLLKKGNLEEAISLLILFLKRNTSYYDEQ